MKAFARAMLRLAVMSSLVLMFLQRSEGQDVKSETAKMEVTENRLVATDPKDRPLTEPHLAIDPENANHWLAAAIVSPPDMSKTECVSLVSFDGGKSWSRHDFGVADCGGDPWAGFLPKGVAVLSVITGDNAQLLFYRSEDGGMNWGAPISLGLGHDHETFLVSRFSEIYLTSAQDGKEPASNAGRTGVYIVRSTDGGRSFGIPTLVFPSNLSLNAMNPGILSDGSLVVSFNDFAVVTAEGQRRLERERSWIVRSRDKGKTFSAPIFVSEACAKTWGWLAIDDTSGAFRDRMYWLCTDGSYEHVFVTHSVDEGEKWSKPIAVNGHSGLQPYVRTPMLAVNKQGLIGVSWYDARSDHGTFKHFLRCQELYFTTSPDGGQTFLPEVKVSGARSCPLSSKNGDAGIRWPAGGDYTGLATTPDGRFHLLWSDSRNGVYQLWTATVTVH
jgi:hypothetical protein